MPFEADLVAASRRGSATNTPGRGVSGTSASNALALVIAGRIAGESIRSASFRSSGVHGACNTSLAVQAAATGGVQPRGSRVNKCQRFGSLPVAADACDLVPLFVWQVLGFPKAQTADKNG